MSLLCKLKHHDWKQTTPKFKDPNKYFGMSFSCYSSSSNFFQYGEICKKCKKTRIVLEEVITRVYLGRKNKITIPRFTIKEAIDYQISKYMLVFGK